MPSNAAMLWLVISQVIGGVVLFLLGMQSLSKALRTAAGDRLREMLTAATSSRFRALALGTTAGVVAHSTAATVMTVSFVNAGLLTLEGALPVLFGANVGTTLSMQLISLRLTDYALAAIALGGVLFLTIREGRWHDLGQGVLGFGLLFFGMKVTGDGIGPYKETLEPFLARIDGSTLVGLCTGLGAAVLLTVIMQSSGAVIGMTFVLAGAGVFTSLWQTFPVVLGAHVGTTVTAVIVSLGTSAEARRAALANVGFNLFNAALGVAFARVLVPLLESTASSVVHQTANAHTAMMVIATVLLLPVVRPMTNLIRRIAWPRAPVLPASHLDPNLFSRPDAALHATMRELGRCTLLIKQSFEHLITSIREPGPERSWRAVRHNEEAINEIRASVRSYLARLARRKPAPKHGLLAQALNRSVVELERIGDHIEHLREFVTATSPGDFDVETRDHVLQLAQRAFEAVERVGETFTAEQQDLDACSWEVLESRNRYRAEAAEVRETLSRRLSNRQVLPARALAFSEIVTALDRIVRHCAVIAQEQRQPSFAGDPEPASKPPAPDAPPA